MPVKFAVSRFVCVDSAPSAILRFWISFYAMLNITIFANSIRFFNLKSYPGSTALLQSAAFTTFLRGTVPRFPLVGPCGFVKQLGEEVRYMQFIP